MNIDIETRTQEADEKRAQGQKRSKASFWFLLAVFLILSTSSVWGMYRVIVLTNYIEQEQVHSAQAQEDAQAVWDACNRATDCDLAGIPEPATTEDSAPPLPEEVTAPVVVQPTLSPSQAHTIGQDAIAWWCSSRNDCQGPGGANAPPATPEQIAEVIAAYCGAGNCDPTYEVVFAAVQSVCADNACVGPTGAAGPPPTDEQVLAQVLAVCSSGQCAGPAGPAGASITAVSCVDTGSGFALAFTATAADGTQTVLQSNAACEPLAPPEPTELPEGG